MAGRAYAPPVQGAEGGVGGEMPGIDVVMPPLMPPVSLLPYGPTVREPPHIPPELLAGMSSEGSEGGGRKRRRDLTQEEETRAKRIKQVLSWCRDDPLLRGEIWRALMASEGPADFPGTTTIAAEEQRNPSACELDTCETAVQEYILRQATVTDILESAAIKAWVGKNRRIEGRKVLLNLHGGGLNGWYGVKPRKGSPAVDYVRLPKAQGFLRDLVQSRITHKQRNFRALLSGDEYRQYFNTNSLELDRRGVIHIELGMGSKVRLAVNDRDMCLAEFRKQVMELVEPTRARLGIKPGNLDLAIQPAYQRTVFHIKPVLDMDGYVQKLGMQVEWMDDMEEGGNAVYDVRGDVSPLRIADLLLFKADTRVCVLCKAPGDQAGGLSSYPFERDALVQPQGGGAPRGEGKVDIVEAVKDEQGAVCGDDGATGGGAAAASAVTSSSSSVMAGPSTGRGRRRGRRHDGGDDGMVAMNGTGGVETARGQRSTRRKRGDDGEVEGGGDGSKVGGGQEEEEGEEDQAAAMIQRISALEK